MTPTPAQSASLSSGPGTHRIVIVGGGAGGLELATTLGKRLGRRGRAEVTLIERDRRHFWKPHLHEIAAGSMDLDLHATNYMAQAHWNGFRYLMGTMEGLDRAAQAVLVAPTCDQDGQEITPQRRVSYDTLVIAVGSQVNDFGTPGVGDHAIALDTPAQAKRFHRQLLDAFFRGNARTTPAQPGDLAVAIIGAGATGVELAAQLRQSGQNLVAFGLDHLDAQRALGIHLIEAGPRVLPALPERLSGGAHQLLLDMHVDVRTNARVAAVHARAVELSDGTRIPAELIVWAAGVKAPPFLAHIDGLETNRANQLVVRQTLQSTRDDAVFALGDCASCAWQGRDTTVPPRAQAAHQQASHLVGNIMRRMEGKPLKDWHYRDFGSLVSLGQHSTVGNLMGSLVGGNLWVEGLFARLMYVSLYAMHQVALNGYVQVALISLARLLARRRIPRVKLH